MKFAHMADCHLGAWRDPLLKDLCTQSFEKAIDISIDNGVEFILISGDLFHTAIPSIDTIKLAVRKLKQVKEKDIPVYIIAGSHDFSPSGKTMIDVLEEAGLVTNVVKGNINDSGELVLEFTTDKKTGAKITGMLGKKGMLEKKFYENLNTKNIEAEKEFKIFMFHTAISELKPKELEKMDSSPVSLLPKGCDYYAGGHVHIVKEANLEGYKNLIYPGPVFPANFAELENLGQGGFYIYHDKPEFIPIELKKTVSISIDANHKSPEQVMETIKSKADCKIDSCIVLIRIAGKLKSGRTNDINIRIIQDIFIKKNSYVVLVNKTALTSEEFDEIKIDQNSAEDIESALIKEHLGQVKVDFAEQEEEITKQLMHALSLEKQEGEKVADYQSKIKGMVREILRV
ncbi:MAG: exonuclease SbcCD subunit D [Nanoarchaeota archaeon]|nr:exonuclease SbcCD subunit D [Nanoarchaeota archaeon]